MESFDFIRMKPDSSVIKNFSEEVTTYVLAEPGEAYAIYCHVPLPWKPEDPDKIAANSMKIKLTLDLPKGKYLIEWRDTKKGHLAERGKFKHKGGEIALESPEFAGDIALKIVSK